MDRDKMARLRELAAKATPGPWREQYGVVVADASGVQVDDYNISNNSAYIAAANPQTVLALLDRIAELEDAAEYSRQCAMERSERD